MFADVVFLYLFVFCSLYIVQVIRKEKKVSLKLVLAG
jgi:hypothetical protein